MKRLIIILVTSSIFMVAGCQSKPQTTASTVPKNVVGQLRSADKKTKLLAIKKLIYTRNSGAALRVLGDIATEDQDWELRLWATTALGLSRNKNAIETVLTVLEKDNDAVVVIGAVDALSDLGKKKFYEKRDERIVNALKKAAKHRFPGVRKKAKEVLNEWGISYDFREVSDR